MDNVDFDNIAIDIKRIQNAHKDAVEGRGSEDKVDRYLRELGEDLGSYVYIAEGPNEFSLDRERLEELKAFGELGGDSNNPSLMIPNPVNKYQSLEVKIISPEEQ